MSGTSTRSNVVPLRPRSKAPVEASPQSSLSDLLYQSVLNAHIWPKFLVKLSSESGADVAILLIEFAFGSSNQITIATGDGLIAVDASLTTTSDPAINALHAVVASRLVPQTNASEMGLGAELKAGCLIGSGLGQASLQLNRDWGSASILLTKSGEGWSPSQSATLALKKLAPDFSYALAALATMATIQDRKDVLAATLPFLSGPVALAQGTGSILSCNPAWDILFRRFPRFKPMESPEWGTACREAVRHGSTRLELAPGFKFQISIVRPNGNNTRDILGAYATERLVVEVLEHPNVGNGRAAFMAGFGLTGTEVDVLDRLKHGASVQMIAEQRRSSPETIRHHLKSIKRKTGITRMPGLIGLASSLL